jgi:Domain of unknown function (DUF4262)
MIVGMAPSLHSDPFLQQIEAIIAAHRFAVVPVGYGGSCSQPGCCGPAAEQPWTYTVGLSRVGLPELVLMGLNPGDAHFGLDWFAKASLAGKSFALDQVIDVQGQSVKLLAIPNEWLLTDPTRMSVWFGQQAHHRLAIGLPRVVQVVWADPEGRFPDDVGYRPEHALRQPILRDDPVTHPHRSSRDLRRAAHRHRRSA